MFGTMFLILLSLLGFFDFLRSSVFYVHSCIFLCYGLNWPLYHSIQADIILLSVNLLHIAEVDLHYIWAMISSFGRLVCHLNTV